MFENPDTLSGGHVPQHCSSVPAAGHDVLAGHGDTAHLQLVLGQSVHHLTQASSFTLLVFYLPCVFVEFSAIFLQFFCYLLYMNNYLDHGKKVGQTLESCNILKLFGKNFEPRSIISSVNCHFITKHLK